MGGVPPRRCRRVRGVARAGGAAPGSSFRGVGSSLGLLGTFEQSFAHPGGDTHPELCNAPRQAASWTAPCGRGGSRGAYFVAPSGGRRQRGGRRGGGRGGLGHVEIQCALSPSALFASRSGGPVGGRRLTVRTFGTRGVRFPRPQWWRAGRRRERPAPPRGGGGRRPAGRGVCFGGRGVAKAWHALGKAWHDMHVRTFGAKAPTGPGQHTGSIRGSAPRVWAQTLARGRYPN